MNTFLLFIWSLVLSFVSVMTAPFKIAKTARSKFGSFFRVVGLGLGRSGIQETRQLVSLGRFRTCDAIPSPQAYTYQAPAGVPGDITRVDESNVEPAMLVAVADVFAQSFGIGMVYNGAGISQVGFGTTAAQFAGVLVRQAPGISSNSDALTGNIPNPVQVQGLCVRGYVNVLCVYGTPARGGVVYLRVNSSVNNTQVGTFDATSDSTDNVALSLTQASWASSGKDANNNAELRIAR
ncbi:MAG: hypothetical protein OEW15_11615 [Nitrospirota bacterium]|nr:hypothetical protein [Nitrospirota bacterium]